MVTSFQVVGSDVDDLFVFADNLTQALQTYFDWCEHWGKSAAKGCSVKPNSRWEFIGEQTILREQMDIGYVGVIGWSDADGWGIYQIDHEHTRR